MRLFALALLAVLIPGCHKSALPPEAPARAKWTLMFYSDADNDLEESAMNDLRQLLKLGSSPQVHLVMLCDRSELDSGVEGYSNERIFNRDPWDQALLLSIGKESLETLEDWGEQNMADPETLERFVKVAQERFPAERYALIIGNHGSGWEGVCSDDSAQDEDDQLTLEDLSGALADIPRLDVLGFDACLMATVETAVTLAPRARYMVASEELEPVLGWDYASIARLVIERPDIDGPALCKIILTSYQRSFQRDANAEVRAEGESLTLSALDLDRVSAVQAALQKLSLLAASKLEVDGRPYWLVLAAARSQSEEYGSDEGEDGSSAFDLLNLAEEIAARAPDRETREAAAELSTAVQECTLDSVRGPARPQANGLSIFFPNDEELLADYLEIPGWQAATAWPSTLVEFVKIARLKPPTVLSQLRVSSDTVLPHEPVTVSAKLKNTAEIASLYFVIAQRESQELIVLGRQEISSEKAPSIEWDGSWLTGPQDTIFPIQSENSFRVAATVGQEKVTLHMHGSELVMATRQGSGGVRQMHLEVDDEIDFLYPTLNSLGRRDSTTLDESLLTVEERDSLSLSQGPVQAGDYEVGFLVVDHAGNWDLQVKPVRYGL